MEIGHIEEMIRKLSGVISCKIVESENVISEVHVLTNLERHPKQISRDIQSVFMASWGRAVDRKCISIAQLDVEASKTVPGRIQIEEVEYNVGADAFAKASVALRVSDVMYKGESSGVNTIRNSDRLIVEATLNGLHQAFTSEPRLVLEDIQTLAVAGQSVYNVAICSLQGRREELHIGSALISGDSRTALVKATLDALNRRMNILLK